MGVLGLQKNFKDSAESLTYFTSNNIVFCMYSTFITINMPLLVHYY